MGSDDIEREERERRQEHARREAAAMLGALENHARRAVELTRTAPDGLRPGDLAFWRMFRTRVDDFRALVGLTGLRLRDMEGERADALRREFRRLDAAMLALYVRVAGAQFRAMLDRSVLPLVAHDVLRPELALIEEALARLTAGGDVEAALAATAAVARADLEEILRRIPALPDFDAPAPAAPARRLAGPGSTQ
jgi:hypothetical protein